MVAGRRSLVEWEGEGGIGGGALTVLGRCLCVIFGDMGWDGIPRRDDGKCTNEICSVCIFTDLWLQSWIRGVTRRDETRRDDRSLLDSVEDVV